jgi:hypothetical protein
MPAQADDDEEQEQEEQEVVCTGERKADDAAEQNKIPCRPFEFEGPTTPRSGSTSMPRWTVAISRKPGRGAMCSKSQTTRTRNPRLFPLQTSNSIHQPWFDSSIPVPHRPFFFCYLPFPNVCFRINHPICIWCAAGRPAPRITRIYFSRRRIFHVGFAGIHPALIIVEDYFSFDLDLASSFPFFCPGFPTLVV